ncbi:tRNA (adenosine(37)-N6)-threonylcarbamoyltransferase complex transferase subunit TsaD [Candidatus Micrarchaeota archaeon]|nr:tRNA (adenosine(37)-N6)-threonylcarbamoyltransferase complex transferase subunit TsaD [Candidatus Micrarchaeota archaeon]
MICLGIESTAHTLGVGIVKNGNVLSNENDTYKPKNEGIVPRKAADHHAEVFGEVLKRSLDSAGVSLDEVGLFSFAQGPGIGSPLQVGCTAARALAIKCEKPLIGVNHPYAHIKIAEEYSGIKNPLILYVSGGNTQILIEEKGRFRVLGETLDIGIGNLYDTFLRAAKLEYAHGSMLEEIAKGGKYVPLPYTVKGTNLSFTGLQTAAIRALGEHPLKDVTYSLVETSLSMCLEALERSLFLTKRKGIISCGGVAQNKRLKEMLKTLAEEDGVQYGGAPDEFNRDNGAMIAYAGELLYKKRGTKPVKEWKTEPNQRIDSFAI